MSDDNNIATPPPPPPSVYEVEDILQRSDSPALTFELLKTWKNARVARAKTTRHRFSTPIFMPVGTQGTVKGLTSGQILEIGSEIILGNTYHLGHRPGVDVVIEGGGLHNFMHFPRNMLTDSGGFQMVSLLELATITEEGVQFVSPHNGSVMMLTPEESITVQNGLGADIIMALDDVIASTSTGPRVEEAMERTLRWIDRCISAHKNPTTQNLFGIIQGGLDKELRKRCIEKMIEKNLPGYAIGGLSGGEDKNKFWEVVAVCCQLLPQNKPRYLMGVGYPLDMVVCVALGVDMFDCVYPSRTARFGTALITAENSVISLRAAKFKNDFGPIEDGCECMTCLRYTRAFLHPIAGKEPLAAQLITYHNIYYQKRLMRTLQENLLAGTFPEFVKSYVRKVIPPPQVPPKWVLDALNYAGIPLEEQSS